MSAPTTIYGPATTRRAGPRRWLPALLAVLVAMAAGGAWWAIAHARFGHVEVRWDPAPGQGGPVTCRGAGVTSSFGGPRASAVIRLRPEMNCSLSVRVVNRGSGTVHLDSIVLPYMGPEAGPEVQVTGLAGLSHDRARSEDGLHAAFEVDRDLEGGESYRFTVPFSYRDAGCTGGTLTVHRFPHLDVSTLGLPGGVDGSGTVSFKGNGRGSGCAGRA